MSWLDDLPRCPLRGKFRHETEAGVRRQMAMLESRGKPIDDGERPYRCPTCGDWHLGHDLPAARARGLERRIAAALSPTPPTKRRNRRR